MATKVWNQQGTIWNIEDEEAMMDDLVVHATFISETNTDTSSNDNSREVKKAILISLIQTPDEPRISPTLERPDSHVFTGEKFNPIKKNMPAVGRGSPQCVKASCLSYSLHGEGLQNKYKTFVKKYKYYTSARRPTLTWVGLVGLFGFMAYQPL